MNKEIHIVCFDVPYPATYGGVIDVFYKIRSLSEIGVRIYLHVFQDGRRKQEELNKYCVEVFYYERKTSFWRAIGLLPYIVSSRSSQELISNLKKIEAPVLFEGIHTTLPLRKKILKNRTLMVRTHNIEHRYYRQLAGIETNLFKRIYYLMESSRLKNYEKVLRNCDHILSIAKEESSYFSKIYGDKVTYLPPFHPSRKIYESSKKGYFALFHGNLNVSDNMKAALMFIDIFKNLPYPLVLAGQSENKKLLQMVDEHKNISFIPVSDDQKLLELLHRAHVNVLYSHIQSGVKLKLINSLFQSRYVIANYKMTKGSGMESICVMANNKKEITNQILKLIDRDFSEKELMLRKEMLKVFDNESNSKKLLEIIQD